MGNNTFIVLSTINTDFGVFSPEERFWQTVHTLYSIHNQAPKAKIYFLDNSIEPLNYVWKESISSRVDVFEQMEHNVFTQMINGNRGWGEAYMMPLALERIKQHGMVEDRIFKLSGRYFLQKSFDISAYTPEVYGKYVFKVNQWDVSKDDFKTHRERVVYFETRLWSFCGSLFDEYQALMPKLFQSMFTIQNWEKAHHALIPHDKVIDFPKVHVEGLPAETGIIKI